MAKESLTVWLRAIAYTGAGIGKDTRFEVSVNNESSTPIQVSMQPGTTRLFNKVVFMKAAEKPQRSVSIEVTAVEEDLVSDIGTNTVQVDVKTEVGRQVLGPIPTVVQENLGILGRRGAASFSFHFDLERWVGSDRGIRYVVSDDNGWLLTRAEDEKGNFSLPHLIKVEVTRVGSDREYFTVLEGPLRGRKGSITLRNGVSSLSPASVKRAPAVQLVYHRRSRKLEVPELGMFDVAWPPRNPFPVVATFHVEIPDAPHEPGQPYEKWATFATTWFLVADAKVTGRYLHVGKRSAGCATVKERDRWDELYRFLINRRLDDRSVATLTVAAD